MSICCPLVRPHQIHPEPVPEPSRTHLFDPSSAGGELPLGDGRLPHADLWGEGENGGVSGLGTGNRSGTSRNQQKPAGTATQSELRPSTDGQACKDAAGRNAPKKYGNSPF